MAYSATVTPTGTHHRGLRILVEETDVQSGSEAPIANLPIRGRILNVSATLDSGDAATIRTETAQVAAGTGTDIRFQACKAAASINEAPGRGAGALYYAPEGKLYHRSKPDSGTNNAVTTEYYIVEGWHD